MDIIKLLADKGFLFWADEPGFFIRCADTTLEYRTWEARVIPTRRKVKAPFGIISAKECNAKGANALFNVMKDNWSDLSYHPEVLSLVTSKCNLDCSYCIAGIAEGSSFRLPSIEQIEKALRLFPVKRVLITGGEPLSEKENLQQILEWLIGKIDRCDIVTNGTAWDDSLWPLLVQCGKEMELWMRLTIVENLSHMKLSEFEERILPAARNNPEVRINLNFLPNHDGSGLVRFLRRIKQLDLPSHITITPSYLTESRLSGPVEFNVGNYLKEMIEIVEDEERYLHKVNFGLGKSLSLLITDLQLLGCRRKTISLSSEGYARCNIFQSEGEVVKGPIEADAFIWGKLLESCRKCPYYPDHCREAIRLDQCPRFEPGCNLCPIVYTCSMRCPYTFNTERMLCAGGNDLQCLGYSLLRVFTDWLIYRNRTWKELQESMPVKPESK